MANRPSSNSTDKMVIRYDQCLKVHAMTTDQFLIDGCREFVKSGDDGSKEAYICATCGCIRGFHKMNNQSVHPHQPTRLYSFNHCGNSPIFRPSMTPSVPTSASQLPSFTLLPDSITSPIQKNVLRDVTISMSHQLPLVSKDETNPETPSSATDTIASGILKEE